jgi:DNA-binding protein HU-beta
LAKTPRTWTGARSPSGLKRVRQAERRHAILQPRRTAAKTLVAKALRLATTPADGADPQVALAEAMSALDRAAKVGAIHPNAAARRKSRLTLKLNAALGGTQARTAAHPTKQVGKMAAAKAAKARIAASKADKAKGAQTAAGKARAALSKSTRAEAAAAAAKATETEKPATTRARSTKAASTKTAAKSTTKATTKASASKTGTTKATASKTGTKTTSRTKKSE